MFELKFHYHCGELAHLERYHNLICDNSGQLVSSAIQRGKAPKVTMTTLNFLPTF